MKGYARTDIFSNDDVKNLYRAVHIVDALPEEGQSCHEVAALVGRELGLPVVRGWFGMVEHSWLRLPSGIILDVYVPGRYPLVQLVDGTTVTLPECYREQSDRLVR